MGPDPTVSVAMPVYNAGKTLAAAIRSILMQSYKDFELLILDDGSTDNSLEITKSFRDERIRVVSDGTRGRLSLRLNQAVGLARGKYFARMDADDCSFPLRLQKQVEFLENNPRVDLVATGAVMFNDDGEISGRFPPGGNHDEICRSPWKGFYLPHPTWMGRMEWFKKHPYNPSALGTEDQDLLLRTHDSSTFACLKEVLFGYRINAIVLKKSLTGRWHFCGSIIREAVHRKNFAGMLEGLFNQSAKGLIETLGALTGLNGFLLKRRARPSGPEEIRRWKEVWEKVNS